MEKDDEKRTRQLRIQLKPKEYNQINEQFKKTTCQHLSDYTRKILLNKKITVYHRNQSLDEFMEEMILLRKELNAIGINLNQLMKRQTLVRVETENKFQTELVQLLQRSLLVKTEEIKTRINQFADQWFQK